MKRILIFILLLCAAPAWAKPPEPSLEFIREIFGMPAQQQNFPIAGGTGTFTTLTVTGAFNSGSIPSPGAIGGTTPAAGTFTALTATGNAEFKGPVPWYDVSAYGAKLDCSADAAAAVQSAIAAMPTGLTGGGTLFFPAGCVRIKSSITFPVKTPILVLGVGPASIIQKDFDTTPLFTNGTQTLGTTTTLTANGNAGDIQMTVTSTTGLLAGDWLLVMDNTGVAGCTTFTPASLSCHNELQQIDTVAGITDGTHLRLANSLSANYTTAGLGQVAKITPMYLNFSYISVTNGPDCAAPGECTGFDISFEFWLNGTIANSFFYMGKSYGAVQDFQSKYLQVLDNSFYNANDVYTQTGQAGAPVQANNSAFLSVKNNSFYKSGELDIALESAHIDFSHNQFHGCADDCINSHGSKNHDVSFSFNTMDGNTASSGGNGSVSAVGIIVGNTDFDFTIQGNTITNMAQCIEAAGASITDVRILDNSCYGVTTNAAGTYPPNYLPVPPATGYIYVASVTRFTVSHNMLYGSFPSNVNGVEITSSTGGIVDGNMIVQTNGGATGSNGMYLPSNTSMTYENNMVTGWNIGSYLNNGTNITFVNNNHYSNSTNYFFNAANNVAVVRWGNQADTGTTFANLAPYAIAGNSVYCNDCTQTTPAAASGTGAIVTYLNGIWTSSSGQSRVTFLADWTCGTGGTVSTCVTATIVGATVTPLTFTLPLVALSYDLDCDGVVSSTTGTPANNWNLITATNGATNVTSSYAMGTAAAVGGFGATTDTASTTTTFSIGGTWTLGAAGTKFPFHIHARIEGASASGTVLSLQVVDPTVADLLTIYRGASCIIHY
jgi:hypothetical protein